MVVLGIDLGTKNICVATPKIHSFGIVLNREAKRINEGILGFTEQDGRLFGSFAKSRQKRNIKNTLYELIRLIGRKWTDRDLRRDAFWWGFDLVKNQHSSDTVAVQVAHNSKHYVLGPEQILAAYISHLRELAIDDLKTKDVRDCCVAVPSYFTHMQRQMVANSCKIAGMNLLSIVNSATAVALMWGLNPMDTGNKSQYVMFVDIGYANTQVGVAQYVSEKNTMQMVCHYSQRNAGGRDIDREMVQYFVSMINKNYRTDVMNAANPNWKVINRLLVACDKLKKKLGLNNEASVMIDCLINGADVTIKLNREKLHELIEAIISRMLQPVKASLANLKTRLSTKSNEAKFQCVELVGGGVRVPLIRQRIEEMIERAKKEIPHMEKCVVRKTMNGDESVSKGTAYLATMLSKSYKVRKMTFYDMTNFDIQVVSGAHPKRLIDVDSPQIPLIDVISRPIWRRGSKIPSTRILELDVQQVKQLIRTPNFPNNYLLISQNKADNLNFGADAWVCKIFIEWKVIANHKYSKILKEHLRKDQESPVILMARMGSDDLLGQFEAYCPILTSVLEAFDKKNEKSLKKKEKSSSKPDEERKDVEMGAEEKEPSVSQSQDVETGEEKDKANNKDKMKNINKKTKVSLWVTTEFIMKNMTPVDKACEVEAAMKKLDDDIANIQNTRNFLETLIYEVRDKLDGQYIPVISPTDLEGHRNRISTLMYKLEDEEEVSKDVKTYTQDIELIKSITKPFDKLLEEHNERPQAAALLTRQIKHYLKITEKADYMDIEKKQKVINKCNTTKTWLDEKISEQKNQPKWSKVVVTAAIIKQKLNDLNISCKPLCKKPTPPPPPEAEEKNDEASSKDEKKKPEESKPSAGMNAESGG